MTFWCGVDPALFIIDLEDANKKLLFFKVLLHTILFEGILHNFSKIKSHKITEIKVFMTIFA
jgi:hypothetical protein